MNIRVSQLNKFLFPEMITAFPETENKIYLTFDDGPTPGVTSRVLSFLKQYNAKATFFCCGNKVESHRTLFEKISAEGHTTGNHGFSHLHGWFTNASTYSADCQKAAQYISNKIFRPPYGKITTEQYRILKKDFKIYLWSALTWDFHPWVSPEKCFRISKKNLTPGSILVFHDNIKASGKLFHTLPRILETGLSKGFEFSAIPVCTGNGRMGSVVHEYS